MAWNWSLVVDMYFCMCYDMIPAWRLTGSTVFWSLELGLYLINENLEYSNQRQIRHPSSSNGTKKSFLTFVWVSISATSMSSSSWFWDLSYHLALDKLLHQKLTTTLRTSPSPLNNPPSPTSQQPRHSPLILSKPQTLNRLCLAPSPATPFCLITHL